MNLYDINKPLLKNDKWLVFPNTVFSEMDTVDCNDTIESRCYEDKSFDQCIELCDKSPDCSHGYYVKGSNKQICAPLLQTKMQSNPLYRLRNEGIYPKEMKYFKTQTFFDKDKIIFPPEEGNNVFYFDDVYLQNVETKRSLFIDKNKQAKFIQKDEDQELIVQLLHIPVNFAADSQYDTVQYGNVIGFNIPTTSLVFRKNISSLNTEWTSRNTSVLKNSSGFKINPVKNINNNVLYSDTFSLETDNYFLGVSDEGVPALYEKKLTYQQMKDNGHNITFMFIPNMEGFYCNEQSVCTQTDLRDMKIDSKGIGRINGLAVGRNRGCWGVCNSKIPGKPKLYPLDDYHNHQHEKVINNVLISVMIIILGVVMIVIVNTLKKHFLDK